MKYPKQLSRRADEILSGRRQAAQERQMRAQFILHEEHPEIEAARSNLSRMYARRGTAMALGNGEALAQVETEIGAEQERLRDLMATAKITEDDLKPPFTCPACGDRGYVSGKPCSCRQTILNQLVYERLCDVSPARECSFENFDLRYYDGPARPAMGKVVDSCQRYVRDFSSGSKAALIWAKEKAFKRV